MPLRVAEKDGYIKAVNCCDDCGFVKLFGVDPIEDSGVEATSIWTCGHPGIGHTPDECIPLQRGFIPVWCPLPEPGISGKEVGELIKKLDQYQKNKEELASLLRGKHPKTMTEFMVRKENAKAKMRGLHPENIVWDEPPVFIVEDPGPPGFVAKEIMIKPQFFQGPDYTCLRKDDCLTTGKENYWLCETPTSRKIKITPGPDLEKGDRLAVANMAIRKEEPKAETIPPLSCPDKDNGKIHYLIDLRVGFDMKIWNKCVCGTEYFTDLNGAPIKEI